MSPTEQQHTTYYITEDTARLFCQWWRRTLRAFAEEQLFTTLDGEDYGIPFTRDAIINFIRFLRELPQDGPFWWAQRSSESLNGFQYAAWYIMAEIIDGPYVETYNVPVLDSDEATADYILRMHADRGFVHRFEQALSERTRRAPEQQNETTYFIPKHAVNDRFCRWWRNRIAEFAEDEGLATLDEGNLHYEIPFTEPVIAAFVRFLRELPSEGPFQWVVDTGSEYNGYQHTAWYIVDALLGGLFMQINRVPSMDSAEEAAAFVMKQHTERGFAPRLKEHLIARTTPVAAPEPHEVSEPRQGAGQAYLVNDRGEIVVFANGGMHVVAADHEQREDILANLYRGAYTTAIDLADRNEAIARAFATSDSAFSLERAPTGEVTLNGDPIDSVVGNRAIEMIDAGLDVDPLVRFLTRLGANPDPRVRQQLLPFVQANDFAIDEEGYIVAWKKVARRADGKLTDRWTEKLDYTPPRVVTMPRDAVVDDPNEACAPGLHFATWGFTYNYGGDAVVEMRVDPADVVSVPHSHVDKGRACTVYIEREIHHWREIDPHTPPVGSSEEIARVFPSSVAVAAHAPDARDVDPMTPDDDAFRHEFPDEEDDDEWDDDDEEDEFEYPY